MTGRLSQSLTNIENVAQHIVSIPNLPSDAQSIAQNLKQSSDSLINDVKRIQSDTAPYVEKVKPLLNEMLALADKKAPVNDIMPLQEQVMELTEAHQTQYGALLTDIQNHARNIDSAVSNIANITSELRKEEASINAQLDAKRSELESAKKKYYYLLALGPFGLVGLATALALFNKLKGEENTLAGKAQHLSNKLHMVKTMEFSLNTLSQEVGNLLNALSSLSNGVSLIRGDLDNIMQDVFQSPINYTVLAIHIHAALAQVEELEQDAA
ncbi:hypothetical protein NMR54_003463 [Vibrio cholerae]|nr:hypothetical protein [Vibrio cholerae]EGQ9332194.1 hypothetical protein [Vibrio cholerae]EIA3091407.1 hypothetical protein [Vibrio cholerae]EJL6322004.1 hypothetical protein [Vibrio cholerae]EJL7023414.1 hypothetical protein [Vibrio cholerae]